MTEATVAQLATNNKEWGFFGTMGKKAEAAWPMAMAAVQAATGQKAEAVRAFLDSSHGRHFADDVGNGLHAGQDLQSAVTAATTRWMNWSITRKTSRDFGIPSGIPYLTGFVIHAEMTA